MGHVALLWATVRHYTSEMTSPEPAPRSGPTWLDDQVRQALILYGQDSAPWALLRQGDNTVYQVGQAQGPRLTLRLHTAARHSLPALTSELDWLESLGHHLPGSVPRPQPSLEGPWVVRVDGDDAQPLWCSLLSWVEGESLPEGTEFTAEQAAQAGTLLAQVHLWAEQFSFPEGFERPTYDLTHFLAYWADLRRHLEPEHLSAARTALLHTHLTEIASFLGDLKGLPGGQGLIHADCHPGNFVQQERGLGLLDWDRCGWGPFLLDLASCTLALDSAERETFLASYTRGRPLPEGYARPLRALRILAAVENLGFLAARPHELPFVVEALPVLEEVAATWVMESRSGNA